MLKRDLFTRLSENDCDFDQTHRVDNCKWTVYFQYDRIKPICTQFCTDVLTWHTHKAQIRKKIISQAGFIAYTATRALNRHRQNLWRFSCLYDELGHSYQNPSGLALRGRGGKRRGGAGASEAGTARGVASPAQSPAPPPHPPLPPRGQNGDGAAPQGARLKEPERP